METAMRRRAVVVLAGITLVAGGVFSFSASVASAQTGESTTTAPQTTVPQTTVPPVDPAAPPPVEAGEIGPLCTFYWHTPAVDGPLVTEVLLRSTGEVVATRTGSGDFVPSDFNTRCSATTTTAPMAPAVPAAPRPGTPSYTG